MKIGLFADTYYPQINGVATSTRILATELRNMGHKVYIFTPTDPQIKSPEFDVFRLPSVAFIFLKSHRASVMYSPKALKLVKKMNLDIVHTQTEFSLGVFGKIASISMKIPHVHTFHTMYPDYVHYIANGHLVTPKMANEFCRFCCNVSKIVIAPTEKVKSYLISIGVKKEIRVFPTGMDFSLFERDEESEKKTQLIKQDLGILPEDTVIVVVGRLAKEKSIDTIIRAMPRVLESIPRAKLVIVGDGPVKKDLEKETAALNITSNVIFAGAVPWTEIGRYYALGDIFANASLTEAQGLTFIEAMAAKVPVVAKSDPCLEGFLVNNETGFLFENDEELPLVLVSALSDREKLRQITENAYENAQKFSAKNFAQNVYEIYESVLSNVKDNKRPSLFKRVASLPVRLIKKIKV